MLVAPGMSLKVVPPSVETCHRTVGDGVPEAAAVKVAVLPVCIDASDGLVVTTGCVLTVSVAADVVDEPQVLVKRARY